MKGLLGNAIAEAITSNVRLLNKKTDINNRGNINSTTRGQMYFIALTSREKLEIQYIPSNLGIERNSKMNEVAIVGRNTPQYQYLGGETLLKMRLDFHAVEEDRSDVIRKCRWLESLTYNDGYDKAPEKIQLVWGSLYRKQIWVIKSVNYDLSLFDAGYGYLPRQAYVDITLGLAPEQNLRVADIR
jgi:hypothetical protein